MVEDKISKTAKIYALQNAVQFKGQANPKAVIGKVIADLGKEGFSPKDIIPVVNSVTKEINKLSFEKQLSLLKKIAPRLLKKEKKERDFSLPELPNAEIGKVVTRFPPEPNGYLHIGHAKAAIVDYEYAKKYEGKFILRFDDTNPENANIDFYDAQKKDLSWLGVKWDEEYRTSDNLKKHYKFAEKLINQNDAYVCTCKSDDIKHGRYHGETCSCCGTECVDNLSLWKDMLNSSLDGAILRLRGDMTCDNSAMRDPTLFRIIEKPHPIHGDKYRLWPTYDFAGAIEDSISGVTHPFRTKEYELRDQCYFELLDRLGLRKPNLMEFARLSIEGMPVSKRKIKPLIESGKVDGYDDIRLPTLRGLRKRGILADAIKQFVLEQGISKVESTVNFGLVESINRKIVDPIAKRLFFVIDPIPLYVEDAPKQKKEISFHPSNKDLGVRTIKANKSFYVQKSDLDRLKIGDVFRLKDLYNVKILEKNKKISAKFAGKDLISDSLKVQWTSDEYKKMEVFLAGPLYVNNKFNEKSMIKLEGFAEIEINDIKSGEIVQFERFGFVRIEKTDNKIVGYFTHK